MFAEYSRRYGVTFHALRTRRAGARRFISFHLLVPDEWTRGAGAPAVGGDRGAHPRAGAEGAAIFTHIEPISDPASYDDQKLDR